jgi:arylsulfatase A-like enzyme/Flp pilus assembly protein TadD
VVLVTIDTLRADHVGAWGAAFARTPTLDALAARGVRFARAFASAPLTLPSHAAILTGREPPALGVRHNGFYRLGPEFPTLAARLREVGYATGAVLGAFVLGRGSGLEHGFDHYDDDMVHAAGPGGFLERPAALVTDRALAWLAAQGEPFFLWVHYYDPHARYRPPPPFAQAFPERPYDGEIAYVDAELGRLLEGLRADGRLERTVLFVASDHGESLGEHGEPDHGHTLYDASLAVPLLAAGPGLPAGRTVEDVARGVDLTPTVLALLGLDPLEGAAGRDLGPVFEGREAAPRVAYAETLATRLDFGWSALFSVRTATHRYVRAPRPELYDLRSDPRETRNLLEGAPDPAARALARELDRGVAEVLAGARDDPVAPPPEELERLRALGYAVEAEPPPESGLDPKDGLPGYRRFVAASEAFGAGDLEAARRLFEEALAVLPGSSRVQGLLGLVHLYQGRLASAEPHLEAAARLNPRSAYYRAMRGELHRARGEEAEAARAYAEAAALDPEEPYARLGLAWRELRAGRAQEARAQADAALAGSPGNVDLRHRLGEVFERAGAYEDALALTRDALAQDPGSSETHMLVAIQLARLGRDAEAQEHLARAGAFAQVPELRNRLAIAYAARGEAERAEEILRELVARHPGYASARRNLATLLRRSGRPEEAAGIETGPL